MREGQVLGAGYGLNTQSAQQGFSGTLAQGYQDNASTKQSPVDASLDRLAKMVECARMDLNELHARLASVSQPSPLASDAKATQSRPSATCRIEERISDITECVVAIGNDLRAARNGLCI